MNKTNNVAPELLTLLRINLTAEAEHAETMCGRDVLYYLAIFSQTRHVDNADRMAVEDEIEGYKRKIS
jgi:hypothetical protein